MERFDFVGWQKQVCSEIRHAGRDSERLLSTLRILSDQAERILVESEQFDPDLVACRAGCKSCCVVNISVLFPEGLAIASYVQNLPETEQNQITKRLEELWRAVRGLTDDERVGISQSCAFIDDAGCCRIYPVRPLLCRSVTSTSAESCREALIENLLGESNQVLMNLFQKELFEKLYLGVGEGLEGAGLEGRSVKLTGLVRYLLKKPEAGSTLMSGEKLDWHDLA